jgi:hypothetical protein
VTREPVASARRWAEHLPREFARRLADALRAGPDAVRALQLEAVLPESAAAVRAALDLAEKGEGPFTAGLLTSRLDVADEQPHVTPVWTGP